MHTIAFEYLQRLFLVNQFASSRLGNLGKMGRGKPRQDGEGQDLGKMWREAKLPDINLNNLASFSYD